MPRSIPRLWPVLLALALTTPARAAGPTSEEEYLADQIDGRWPQQLSQDGAWLVHIDGQGRLIRRRATPPHDISHTQPVPPGIRVISASRTAAKVALISDEGCVGVMTLTGEPDAPKQQWLPATLLDAGETARQCPPPAGPDPRASPGRRYRPQAVALSIDGTRVALVARGVVRLIDVARAQVLREFPLGTDQVLHLRFLDNDRRLLVTSAQLGEQWEGASLGSEMHFAVWNTQTGALHQLHRTGLQPGLLAEDLLWDYSDATGLLRLPHTGGRLYPPNAGPDTGRQPVRADAVSLKRCGAMPEQPLTLPIPNAGSWLEWAADPLGRWIAAVEIQPNQPGTSRLKVWDTRRGAVLLDKPIETELRSLVASADGRWLFGVRSGKPSASQQKGPREQWAFPNGGQWQAQAIDVPAPPAGAEAAPAASWSDQPCLLPDEAPGAREIRHAPRPTTLRFDLTLTSLSAAREQALAREQNSGIDPAGAVCTAEQESRVQLPAAWGLDAEGRLWLDRWDHLERIDAATGRVEARVPTPRTARTCSVVSYARAQFLNWQGDTVTLRPFAAELQNQARRVVVQRPGWRAEAAGWVGPDHVGVRWIRRDAPGKAVAPGEVGAAFAITYRIDATTGAGTPVHEEAGSVTDGRSIFPSEEGIPDDEALERVRAFSPTDLPALDAARRGAVASGWRWRSEVYASLAAQEDTGAQGTRPGRIMLWDGLRSRAEPGPGSGLVLGLAGSVGAAVQSDGVTLYDATARSRIAVIRQPGVTDLAWQPASRTLLLEARPPEALEPHLRALRLAE